MEEFGREIAFPSLNQVIDVNRRMIESSGGSFTHPNNLRNQDSLEYILHAIKFTVFDFEMFGSIKQKASALAYEIISSHVFLDGNKRTAIHIAWEFLKSNHIPVHLDGSVEELAVQIALGGATREDLLIWLHDHQNE